jgi:hypothetical protein
LPVARLLINGTFKHPGLNGRAFQFDPAARLSIYAPQLVNETLGQDLFGRQLRVSVCPAKSESGQFIGADSQGRFLTVSNFKFRQFNSTKTLRIAGLVLNFTEAYKREHEMAGDSERFRVPGATLGESL